MLPVSLFSCFPYHSPPLLPFFLCIPLLLIPVFLFCSYYFPSAPLTSLLFFFYLSFTSPGKGIPPPCNLYSFPYDIVCLCLFSCYLYLSSLAACITLLFLLPFPLQPVSLYCYRYPSPPGTCFLNLLLIVSLSSCYLFPSFPATRPVYLFSCYLCPSPIDICIPLLLLLVSFTSCYVIVPSYPTTFSPISLRHVLYPSPVGICVPLL